MKSQPAIVAKNQSFGKRELSADTLSDRLFSPLRSSFLVSSSQPPPVLPFLISLCLLPLSLSLSLSFLPYPISTQPHPLVVNPTPPSLFFGKIRSVLEV